MTHHNILYPPWGWENLVMPNNELHVIPLNDDRLHVANTAHDCWCGPLADPDDDGHAYIIRHNAADGREAFETNERKPS